MRRAVLGLAAVALAAVVFWVEQTPRHGRAALPAAAGSTSRREGPEATRPRAESPRAGDADSVAAAFAAHARDVVVEDRGDVVKLLKDDREGRRHQRFLVRVAGGTTVLIAHNLELAPRVEPLAVGDGVAFRGVYVWNAKGGLVHWTHDDPDRRHPAGWVDAGGRRFR